MYRKILITAVTAFFALSVVYAEAKDVMQIKGSDTLVNVVQRLAEVYMEKNPGEHIAVTGGGSGTGIAAIMNGTCDIANASRDINAKEIIAAGKKGLNPVRIVVGLDCVTVVVSGSNKVDMLTVEQLGAIFRGEITNWKELGGDDMPITLYGRQSNSGTYAFFMEDVLRGDYSEKMNQMNGNSQIVEAIKADKTGIGYVGLGHARSSEGLKAVKVAKKEGGKYIDPLGAEAISGGQYPILRTLNQYTNGKPFGKVRDFVAFELSPEGQKIMEEAGFIPVPKEYAEYNATNAGV